MKKVVWSIAKLLLLYFAVMIILYCVCVGWVFAARAAEPPFDPNDHENIYENIYDTDNIVFEWEVYKLHNGLDGFEMYDYLGKAQRMAGTGNLIVEYFCFNGSYLYVHDNGTYYFSNEQMYLLEGVDVVKGPMIAPVTWCFVASAVIVFGGYVLKVFYRRRKASLTSAPGTELNIPVSTDN